MQAQAQAQAQAQVLVPVRVQEPVRVPVRCSVSSARSESGNGWHNNRVSVPNRDTAMTRNTIERATDSCFASLIDFHCDTLIVRCTFKLIKLQCLCVVSVCSNRLRGVAVVPWTATVVCLSH